MQADFVTGRWSAELEDLFLRVSGRFGRVEVRRRMRDYVRGLLGPVGRKNSWQLAEYAGHNGPYGLQHLLSRSRWDPDELRDDVQEYVAQRLGAPDGVLIVDDTGFLKKGVVSAGVQRQYSGTAGRTETARSASSPTTPPGGDGLWWTGSCTCPSHGRTMRAAARPRAFLPNAALPPRENSPTPWCCGRWPHRCRSPG